MLLETEVPNSSHLLTNAGEMWSLHALHVQVALWIKPTRGWDGETIMPGDW